MLLTLTCTAPNADDLGYLLHKNPANVFEAFSTAMNGRSRERPERVTEKMPFEVQIDVLHIARPGIFILTLFHPDSGTEYVCCTARLSTAMIVLQGSISLC